MRRSIASTTASTTTRTFTRSRMATSSCWAITATIPPTAGCGLPGDRIQMKDGELHINGAALKRERVESFEGSDACGGGPSKVKRWRETLPEGATYETLDCVDRGFYDNTNVFTVPAGHLFVLGDNRDNSTDSRVTSVGYIPLENLVGRVGMIFFSRDADGDG